MSLKKELCELYHNLSFEELFIKIDINVILYHLGKSPTITRCETINDLIYWVRYGLELFNCMDVKLHLNNENKYVNKNNILHQIKNIINLEQ